MNDIEVSPQDYGWVREDEQPEKKTCVDMIEGLLEAVYVTGNVESIEFCLEELAYQYGINVPSSLPVIDSKKSKPSLRAWVEFNQKHNMSLVRS